MAEDKYKEALEQIRDLILNTVDDSEEIPELVLDIVEGALGLREEKKPEEPTVTSTISVGGCSCEVTSRP